MKVIRKQTFKYKLVKEFGDWGLTTGVELADNLKWYNKTKLLGVDFLKNYYFYEIL